MSNEPSPRRTPRKKTLSLAPLYGALGIVILAIIVVAMAQKDKDARADSAKKTPTTNESSNPFADVPRGGKVIPSPFDTGASDGTTTSAGALLQATVWVNAMASAEKAKQLLLEANEADRLGDRATYKKKAVEARELFHGALEATAMWEIEIEEAHGESDSQVSKVRSRRSIWFSQRKKLRKVDVNDL